MSVAKEVHVEVKWLLPQLVRMKFDIIHHPEFSNLLLVPDKHVWGVLGKTAVCPMISFMIFVCSNNHVYFSRYPPSLPPPPHTHAHRHTSIHTRTHTHTHTHTQAHAYRHTHKHTHMYTPTPHPMVNFWAGRILTHSAAEPSNTQLWIGC